MDIALLDRLSTISWSHVRRAADLGCGTGRTGAWLARHGVDAIDGVDVTPEMLTVAGERGVYRRLVEADVSDTGLAATAYDLVTCCLVDEHLAELAPLYREVSRIADRGAQLALVGYHPQFIMAAGMPTHFDSASGEPLAISTYVHPLSEHVAAARGAGWQLAEMHERFIDDEWVALKPKWARYRGQPISFAFVWSKPG
jgi:SAM-dependent methyltransferase